MTANLTALPSPAPSATAGDHASGAVTAAILTVVGTIAMPLLGLAWVAVSPLLSLAVALRAFGSDAAATARGEARGRHAAA